MRALLRSPRLRVALPAFRTMAHLEAVSWVGLLLGMALEYGPFGRHATGDALVSIFGSIHGGLVIAFVALAGVLYVRLGWSRRTLALAVAATVPPFATVVFDLWARRTVYRRSEDGHEGVSSPA